MNGATMGYPPQYGPPPMPPPRRQDNTRRNQLRILAVVVPLVLVAVVIAGIDSLLGDPLHMNTAATSSPAASHTAIQAQKPAAKAAKQPKQEWPPTAVHITQKQLGGDWPFRDVTSGYVGCDVDHPGVIVFTPSDGPPGVQGSAIAINGLALDAGYPDIPNRIWIPDPQSGARKSISPVQDLAPNRCWPPS
jgi:hypothetical protein